MLVTDEVGEIINYERMVHDIQSGRNKPVYRNSMPNQEPRRLQQRNNDPVLISSAYNIEPEYAGSYTRQSSGDIAKMASP